MVEYGLAERSVQWFAKNAPRSAEWSRKQKSYGLKDASTYAKVIRAFAHPDSLDRIRVEEHASQHHPHLLLAMEDFSVRVRRLSDNKTLQKACIRFQCLILYSLGIVLEDMGNCKEKVDKIVAWTQPDAIQRAHTFQAVRWVHEVIRRLHLFKGWSLEMATQLFFLGK